MLELAQQSWLVSPNVTNELCNGISSKGCIVLSSIVIDGKRTGLVSYYL